MVAFREVQYMRHVRWLMLLIVGTTALMWWGFYQQIIMGEPWGNNPAPDWMMWLLWLIIGIGFPVAFYWMRLIVEVSDHSVSVRYVPFTKTSINISDIQDVEVRTYKPIREYGGWGIRGSSQHRAYNVSGNRGVELTCHNYGRIIMIGSQNAEDLGLAIKAQLPR